MVCNVYFIEWEFCRIIPLSADRGISVGALYAGALQLQNNSVLTYLLTPWCRVFLDKLTGLHLVKKFPAFHGTRRFITALTSVRHLSLSWASPIQSIYPQPTAWRSILILSTHLRLGFPSDTKQHTRLFYSFFKNSYNVGNEFDFLCFSGSKKSM